MNVQIFYFFCYKCLYLIIWLSGPPIVISTIAGLVIAIIQTATQIQEQTLSFLVKLLLCLFSIWSMSGIISHELSTFTKYLFTVFANKN